MRTNSFLAPEPVGAKEPGTVDHRANHDLGSVDAVVNDVVAVDQLAGLAKVRTNASQVRRLGQQCHSGEHRLRKPAALTGLSAAM